MDFELESLVKTALLEDAGFGDITTSLTVAPGALGQAVIIPRQALVLSGLEAARLAFALAGPEASFTALAQDGDYLSEGSPAARISGRARSILTAERVALNFLRHLSGVATLTSRYVAASRQAGGSGPKILDTRKTTPGLRALEKAAVRHGGGFNHRFSLNDGILIKDNHIMAAGSVEKALRVAKTGAPHTLKVEIEVDTLEQLREALIHGADCVLLDNMGPEKLKKAVEMTRDFFAPNPRLVTLEASGGVNLDTVGEIAKSGVDFISVGALTHSAPSADLGLDWL